MVLMVMLESEKARLPSNGFNIIECGISLLIYMVLLVARLS